MSQREETPQHLIVHINVNKQTYTTIRFPSPGAPLTDTSHALTCTPLDSDPPESPQAGSQSRYFWNGPDLGERRGRSVPARLGRRGSCVGVGSFSPGGQLRHQKRRLQSRRGGEVPSRDRRGRWDREPGSQEPCSGGGAQALSLTSLEALSQTPLVLSLRVPSVQRSK